MGTRRKSETRRIVAVRDPRESAILGPGGPPSICRSYCFRHKYPPRVSCLSSPPRFLLSFDADARNRAVLSRLVIPSRVTRKRTSKGMKATGIINAFAKTYNVSLFCRSRVKVGESHKNTSVSDGEIKVLREETEDEWGAAAYILARDIYSVRLFERRQEGQDLVKRKIRIWGDGHPLRVCSFSLPLSLSFSLLATPYPSFISLSLVPELSRVGHVKPPVSPRSDN